MKRKHSLFLLLPAIAMVTSGCDMLNNLLGKGKDDKDNTQQTGDDNTGGDDTGGGQQTVAVTGVTLNESSKTIEVDESFTLVATVLPENATNKSVSWSSNNSNIASVVDGVVTGKAAGDAVITVTTGDGSKTTTCSVTVKAKQEQTNYGTVEAPITVSQAGAIISAECKNNNDTTKSAMVIQGDVKAVRKIYTYDNLPSFEFDITDGTTDLYVYRCLGTDAQKADFAPGSVVKLSAKAKNYNGTLELCDVGDDKSTMLSVAACTKHASQITAVHVQETIGQGASLILESVNLDIEWQEGGVAVVHPTLIDLDTSVAGQITGTAHYGTLTKTFTITVTPSKENKIVEAYEAGVNIGKGNTTTEKYYFEGVVVGKRGTEYFVQHDGYGIDVYNPSTTLSVGDKVGVTATIKNYNNLIETGTIDSVEKLGTETLPEAVKVTSGDVLDNLKCNILCEIEAKVQSKPTIQNDKDLKLMLTIGSDSFIIFLKKNLVSTYKSFIESLEVGDDVKVLNAVTSVYNADKQILVIDGTTMEKIAHAVTGVSLDHTELTLEAGAPAVTLTPTITPTNASNKAVSWESSAPAVASVENGVVTPLAEGNATITVKTADGEYTATCVVTVTAATRTMTGIVVEGPTKTEYEVGQTLDLDGLVVKAVYDSGAPEVITAGYETSIANGATLTLTDTSFTVSYLTFTSDPIALTVNEKGPIVKEGSYTIKHVKGGVAYYMVNPNAAKSPTPTTDISEAAVFDFIVEEGSLCEYKIKLHGEEQYLSCNDANDGVRIGTTAAIWKIETGTQPSGAYNISTNVGTTDAPKVRFLTLYNTQDFRAYTSTTTNRSENTDLESVVVKNVSSIAIKQNPTKMTYYVGEAFDPTGMIVTVNYTDGSSEDITEGFTFEGSTGFQAANPDRNVKITYMTKTANVQHVAVVADDRTIDSIKFADSCDMTKKTYYVGDEFDSTGLKVVAIRSDSSEFELSASDVTFTYDKSTATASESMTVNVTAHYKIDDSTTLSTDAKAISNIVVKEKEAGVKLIIDGTNLTSTATSGDTDVDCGGITCTMSAGAKKQSSSGDNRFSDSAILIGKNGAHLFNKNAIPGKITKFEVYVNKGASAKVTFGILFSDTPISEYSTGNHTATFGDGSSLGLDQVYDASDKLTDNCQYFWYQVTNANNSQVEFRITYVPTV